MHPILIILLALSLLAMWVAVVYSAYKAWAPLLVSRRMPIQRTAATVSEKRDEKHYLFDHGAQTIGQPVDPQKMMKMEPVHWFLSFDCADGKRSEFSVSQKVYDLVETGDNGELSWRGILFVDFVKPGQGSDYDEAFRSVVKE